MKKISRRDFVQLCIASAATLGLSQTYVPQIAEAFENATKGKSSVIWIQGGTCTGCSLSLLNSVHPDIKELLLEIINLNFHPTLGVQSNIDELYKFANSEKGQFYLIVEGTVPTADNGQFCTVGSSKNGKRVTFLDLVKNLGIQAKSVLALGTCASFGGIPAAKPNPTECVGINSLVDQNKVINLPGCSPHPDWIIGTLAHLLLFDDMPEVDDFGRPKMFYGNTIHDNCPRRQYFDNSTFAKQFGDQGCLLLLGCKGPMTFADCTTRLWNSGLNSCINSGAPCLGCTHPDYPNQASPFYERMGNVSVPGIDLTANTIGKVAGIATGIGLAAHLTGNKIKGRLVKKQLKDGE